MRTFYILGFVLDALLIGYVVRNWLKMEIKKGVVKSMSTPIVFKKCLCVACGESNREKFNRRYSKTLCHKCFRIKQNLIYRIKKNESISNARMES